jgi:MFS family permease
MSEPSIPRASAYGWLVWFLGAAFFAYGFAHRVAPSVMFDYLMRDFAVGAGILGNLAACYLYAYGAMQIPIGILLDRLGPRLLLAVAATVCAAGSFLFAAADTLAAAYVGRLLIGAGAGAGFIATLMLANQWLPPERFAMVSGLTMTVAMSGAVAGQAPLGAVIDALGWRAAHDAAGVLGLAIAAAIWFVVRRPTPPRVRSDATPERPFGRALASIVRSPQIWLVAYGCAALSTPILAFAILWGVPFLVQVYGLPRAVAGLGTSLFLIGLAIGAPILGHWSDRLRRRKPIIVAAPLVLTAMWCIVLFVPAVPVPVLFALFFAGGLASGATPITYAMARDLSSPELRGTTAGFVNLFPLAGGAIMQPAIGVLLDRQWDGRIEDGVRVFTAADYAVAFLPFPIIAALTTLAMAAVRETYGRPPVTV